MRAAYRSPSGLLLLVVVAAGLGAGGEGEKPAGPAAPPAGAGPQPDEFRDAFKGKLGPGWSWVREDRSAWRVGDDGLEVRIQPGNMWGRANDARNLLVRPAPDPVKAEVDVSVTVRNAPKVQWEQADLVWYYDDAHQVKCGQELVDGKLCIVMGREEADRTRTIKIVPLDSNTVSLRLVARGNRVRGFFRRPADQDWREVGACDLPVKGEPKVCLQFYRGPEKEERWVRVTDFRMTNRP